MSHPLQSDWRVDMRLGLCRLASAHPLIGSTIREFSIRSALWVLEVLCCLYWHSSYQIDQSMLWWTVVGVNWLMLSWKLQECFGPIIVPIQKVKTHNFLYCTSMLLVNRTFVRISDLFLGWLILSATYYACVHHAVWKSSCFDCNFSSHYLFECSYHACV